MYSSSFLRAVALGFVIIAVSCPCTNCAHSAEVVGRKVEWPCTDRSAIQWVRHPRDCSKYYICHFGQPLSMPVCPYGQVWGIKAKNCVPEHSRWNDCDVVSYSVNNRTENVRDNHRGDDGTKRQKHHRVLVPTTPESIVVSIRPTQISAKSTRRPTTMTTTPITTTPKSTPITASTPNPPKSTYKPRRPTRLPQNDYGKNIPPKATQMSDGERDEKDTRYPTVTSPYLPNPKRKYYTYSREIKPKMTKKPKKKPTHAPRLQKETKPTKKTKPTKETKPQKERKPMKAPTMALPTTRRTFRTTPSTVYESSVAPTTAVTPRRPPQQPRRRKPEPKATPKPRVLSQDAEPSQAPRKTDEPRTTRRPPRTTSTPRRPKPTSRARPTPRTTPSTPKLTAGTTVTTTRQSRRRTPRPTSPTRPTAPTMKATPTARPTARATSPTTTTPPPQPTTTIMMTTKRIFSRNEGRSFGLSTPEPSEWAIKPMQLRLPEDHPCRHRPGQLVGHPKQCHWYYNCTVAALENVGGHLSALEEECRYPQLFDMETGRCREFINVRCQDRFEPVDPCEYQALQCRTANCVPCHNRFGTCRGRENGIYPFHTHRWTPTFVTCYQERNIAQDDCQPPTPIFSPDALDCVALFDVPKQKGGLRPDCSFREDGFYPDEQGRCGIFFECLDGEFAGYDECPSGTVFDPMTVRCQLLDRSTPPCGEGQNPSCADRQDGFHADPFGRCPYYFECRKNQFVRHLTCDFGSFDPITQECVIPTELIPQPCGLLPNPCEGKPSGFYPDESSNCRHYIECSRGVMISNGTCPAGSVFSAISGRCDRPENAPEPCGLAPSCKGKEDGKYSALTRGCSFYFECRKERFAGLKQCTIEDGGFFFNERTGKCDFPQNICPPCGYRWWGCPRFFYR